MKTTNLFEELTDAGAKPEEARVLAELAGELRSLGGSRRPMRRWLVPAGAGLVVATAVLLVTTASLTTLPGQPLHGVKVGAEAVAATVDPGLKPWVMMDRSWEVEQLAQQHRPDSEVLAALASYNQALGQVKTGDHYAAWNYCAKQLQAASRETSGSTQAAIQQSLSQISRYES